MASRAIIGKVDRQGNGQAIYLGHGCCPDDAGAMLLEHYSDEKPIERLIGSGAIARLASTPGTSITYFRHYHQPWERCQPYVFCGGTEWLFANYWSPAPEWQEWLRRTREFRRPQPLHSLIRAYRPQQPVPGRAVRSQRPVLVY